ncbi:hypothetical protein D1AOALGA4SA_6119 [Olavius algarvensis Delta 1 endosymbiont]|nr:hypothetical protein D1AOALGA4SA_6119 [Olavius algarvensis Delta 1 endosymbiont]
MLTAVFHIVGVMVALIVVLLASGLIDSHFSQKRFERTLETASVKLDLPRRGVFTGEYDAQIARYLADRYDADRISNRISDIGRPAFLVLEWFSYAVQLSIVVIAGWCAFTKDPAYAAAAWFALVAAIVFWVVNVLASALMYLATGRVPGEARDARALFIKLRNEEGRSPANH